MTEEMILSRTALPDETWRGQPDMLHAGRGIYVHRRAQVEDLDNVGDGTFIWAMAYVMAGAQIGRGCMLGQGVHVGPDAIVGDRCSLQNGAQVFAGVELADEVFIGPHVVFTNVLTPRAFAKAVSFRRTKIERGVSIGANATIVCGHAIGEYAMIGAGTVITKNVEPHALMIGVPARKSCFVCVCGKSLTQVGLYHVCRPCNRQYRVLAERGRLVEEARATP